ncbi:toxin [Thermoactinomyces sp. DSM 45891]|uniref:hypothetical protein n=1 Tax=Thermoactinomyces sp. DSM 45891 TaxID=1761907 RepID=UPI000913C9E8|nr:hypothetical protein [Thermoactinomyces sp. DSM 45891]SFX64896.1 toxin [Thermoactinomyces sp. DSM 45891]
MSTLIVSNKDSNNKYNFIYAVDQSDIDNAIEQATAYDAAIDPRTNGFDLNKGLQIANRNGTLLGQIDRTIVSETIQVDYMVDRVMGILKDFLRVDFPTDQITNELTAAMQSTFTNLHTQEDSAWVFWSDEGSYNTTYLYNMLFGMSTTLIGPDYVSVVPMGFEISVDIEKEKVLWVTVKDIHRYSVRLTALHSSTYIGQDSCSSHSLC